MAGGRGGPDAVKLVYNRDNSHTVFIDYKWFYVRNQRKVRYFPGEPALPQECYDKSFERKGYGEKVMYMCAVTNPCPEFPDGKIGMFPCVKRVQTQRGSNIRAAGIWHNVDVPVTGKFHAALLKDKLFPILEEKWTEGNIFIQTDNARPQVGKAAKDAHTGRFKMVRQPPNSPDLQVLDEGLFHRLQVAVDKARPGHDKKSFWARKDLEKAVDDAWEATTGEHVAQALAHLIDVNRAILSVDGGNCYKRASKFAVEKY